MSDATDDELDADMADALADGTIDPGEADERVNPWDEGADDETEEDD